MSQENLEMAHRVFDALNRGDIHGAMKDMTADFVFDFSRSMSPERGVYELEDEAGGRLVTPMTTYNRGRDGIELQTRTAWLWSFRDGQVARVTFFQDRGEALDAAELSE